MLFKVSCLDSKVGIASGSGVGSRVTREAPVFPGSKGKVLVPEDVPKVVWV